MTHVSVRADETAKRLKQLAPRRKAAAEKQFRDDVAVKASTLGLLRQPGDLEKAVELALYGNSLKQGGRTHGGSVFETQIADQFRDFLELRTSVTKGWKLPGFRAKPLDLYIPTDPCDYVFSLKISTRERAAVTWNSEYLDLEEFYKETGDKFRFIALTEDPINLHLQAKLKVQIEYKSVVDHDSMTRLLKDIWNDLQ